MARKKSFLGSLVKLGGLAAVTAVAYKRRDEIKKVIENVADRWFPDGADETEVVEEEPDVIIDVTIEKDENETGEETWEN